MRFARRSIEKTFPPFEGRIEPLEGFTSNPGALTGSIYLPPHLQADAPLIVVLHGCTQTAFDYAAAAGWVELADRHGFAVLLPQQQRANNANLCFNWFERGDIQRDMGEPASIKAMIDCMVTRHKVDTTRIFVTGLSAGAAMAGTMLACYPEIFAGGGLIAGLPHGTASSVQTAFQQMRRGPRESAQQLAGYVNNASDHDGPWPRVSIWHGDADATVNVVNGDATLAQWLSVHNLEDAVPATARHAGVDHRTWRDARGQAQVEHRKIAKMGHGTPIDLDADDPVGQAVPYVLNAGIASSEHLLAFWGLGDQPLELKPAPIVHPATQAIARRPYPTPQRAQRMAPVPQAEVGVAKIINDALRAAGLMK